MSRAELPGFLNLGGVLVRASAIVSIEPTEIKNSTRLGIAGHPHGGFTVEGSVVEIADLVRQAIRSEFWRAQQLGGRGV